MCSRELEAFGHRETVEDQRQLYEEQRAPVGTDDGGRPAYALIQRSRQAHALAERDRPAKQQVRIGSPLVQQAGKVGGRCAGANDRYLSSPEGGKVMVLRAVSQKLVRLSGQRGGKAAEIANARRHDHEAGTAIGSFGELQRVLRVVAFDCGDGPVLEVRHKRLLEFATIVHEGFGRRRQAEVGVGNAVVGAVLRIGKAAFRIIERCREPIGLQQHAFGHPARPGFHGSAKNTKSHPARLQMRGYGQSKGAGADDGNVALLGVPHL